MFWLREVFQGAVCAKALRQSSLACPRNRKGPETLEQSSEGDSNHYILSSRMLVHGLHPIFWTSLVFTAIYLDSQRAL